MTQRGIIFYALFFEFSKKGEENLEERLLFDVQTLSNVTVEDCIDMYRLKGYCAICNDGRLEGFVKEPKANENLKLIWLNAAI